MKVAFKQAFSQMFSRSWRSMFVILIFTGATIVRFWPALSGTISLSKIQQLAEWDSLFAAQKTGQSMLMDPSLAYFMMPYYLLKSTLIRAGQLPLWNQYSGLGCPLAADPEALAFSPLHLPLIFSPGFLAYHQVLVLEIIILGLSTFALARSLKMGLFASIFAMMAVAFCPYERWYLELLGNGFCFVPLVFWLILSLRQKISAARVWLTGFGCAMMVLTAHPELSFCSIMLASIALLLYVFFDRSALTSDGYTKSDSDNYKTRLKQSAMSLAGAGVIAFMLAAPMLLPFLEYLRNCDSYKFGSGAPAIVRWQTWFFDLLQPGFGGASPTLGPCALLLMPLAFAALKSQKTMVKVITGLTVFCLALTGKVFPLNLILSHPPFSYLVVNYAFPAAILMTAVLAAYGLNAALQSTDITNKDGAPSTKLGLIPVIFSIALALLVCTFAPLVKATHLPLISANFDMCLPDYAFDKGDVVRYSVYAALAALAVLLVKFKPHKWTAAFLMAAICLGQTAEITTSVKSLPKRPAFKYEENITLPALSSITAGGKERFIATGNHLFRPNSNVVFGLSDLRTHNAIYPRGYIKYMEACGAKLDGFNQVFDSPLSPLLNLASVEAVLTQSPILTGAELDAALAKMRTPGRVSQSFAVEPEPGIKATFTPIFADFHKRAVFGYLTLKAAESRAKTLTYSLALYDAGQDVQWISDSLPLQTNLDKQLFIAIPMPVSQDPIDKDQKYLLAIQFYDNQNNRWLSPAADNGLGAKLKDVFELAHLSFDKSLNVSDTTNSNSQYKLVFESPSRLRIYKNSGALPRAYAVHANRIVSNEEAALAAIKQPSFEPRKMVIIDASAANGQVMPDSPVPQSGETTSTALSTSLSSIASEDTASKDTVTIVSLLANQVVIEAALQNPGIVVLNDNYYPGWQATVDGRTTQIKRANYLMRAVQVPAGKHRIIFSYLPWSFVSGALLSAIALLAGAVMALKTLKNRLA